MIYHQISYVIFGIFIALALYFALNKKYVSLFLLLLLSAGVGGFNIYIGTLWFPHKIISLLILMIILFNLNRFFYHKYFKMLITLFIFALCLAIIFLPSSEPEFLPFFQRKFVRPFLQLISYTSIAAIIPFTLRTLKTQINFQKIFKNYYLIVEIIMFFAILQFILIKIGIDFMPIIRPNAEDSMTAGFTHGNMFITRLYGISGEPKTLAAFLFPYFFISLYNLFKENYNRSHLYHLLMLFLCLFVMVNAYSSAILISLILCMLFSVAVWFKSKIKFVGLIVICIFIIQYVNIGSFSLIKANESISYNVYNVITARTVTRLQTESNVTIDYKATRYLIENKPMALLTGLGIGMYPYYLQMGGRHGIDPIDSNWIAFLMDFGLLGIALFIYIFYKVFKIRGRKIFNNNIMFNSFLIGLSSSYFLGLGMGSYFYMILFLSLTLASYRIIKNNVKSPTVEYKQV